MSLTMLSNRSDRIARIDLTAVAAYSSVACIHAYLYVEINYKTGYDVRSHDMHVISYS